MTDKTSALILEHLRVLRLEMGVANLHGDFAGQSERIDRVEGRLERVEHRLRLREA